MLPPLRPAIAVLALGILIAPSMAFASDEKPEAVVEDVSEERTENDADRKPEDADPGEASYNTEDCGSPDEEIGDEVEADDLDAECDTVVK